VGYIRGNQEKRGDEKEKRLVKRERERERKGEERGVERKEIKDIHIHI